MSVVVAEDRFPAMAGEAIAMVTVDVADSADAASLLAHARRRIEQLEACWSRFRPDSELCRLHRRAGSGPQSASPDLLALVAAMAGAWRTTSGWYDPTVLGSLEALGYDRSFELIEAAPAVAAAPQRAAGMETVTIDVGDATIDLPAGVALDPGGIGKGLAADLVVEDLLGRGAKGALINVSGDLRAAGSGPTGRGWPVGVEVPDRSDELLAVVTFDGALATSGTRGRRWHRAGHEVHDCIDPHSGRPAASDLVQVTVAAESAAGAEALSTAALIAGRIVARELLRAADAPATAGLLVGVDGRIERIGALFAGQQRPAPRTRSRAAAG